MGFTSYINTRILNHVFRNQPYTSPSKVYVGLFTSGNTEISGNGYARQEITFNAPTADGNGMKITNSDEIRFPIAIADWGNVAYGAIFDSATGGNRLTDETFNINREVRANDQVIFAPGNYTVKIRPS